MCGIVGIVSHTEVAARLYDGLTVLQHRGQDAAGIATSNGQQIRVEKGNGLVSDVFDAGMMSLLQGNVVLAPQPPARQAVIIIRPRLAFHLQNLRLNRVAPVMVNIINFGQIAYQPVQLLHFHIRHIFGEVALHVPVKHA